MSGSHCDIMLARRHLTTEQQRVERILKRIISEKIRSVTFKCHRDVNSGLQERLEESQKGIEMEDFDILWSMQAAGTCQPLTSVCFHQKAHYSLLFVSGLYLAEVTSLLLHTQWWYVFHIWKGADSDLKRCHSMLNFFSSIDTTMMHIPIMPLASKSQNCVNWI